MTEGLDVSQLALLGEAVDCVGDIALFVWDDDRHYVAVNQAACRLLGKSRTEILQMRVGDMTPNRASPLFEDVQRSGVHTGTHAFDGGVVEFLTTRTTIAGLPYMVSLCWQRKTP
jgi:PAS domain-containing protein